MYTLKFASNCSGLLHVNCPHFPFLHPPTPPYENMFFAYGQKGKFSSLNILMKLFQVLCLRYVIFGNFSGFSILLYNVYFFFTVKPSYMS